MQILRIILVIAICLLFLEGMRAGWVATRPHANRSGNARSREDGHGKD
jgi:hypothetical protein